MAPRLEIWTHLYVPRPHLACVCSKVRCMNAPNWALLNALGSSSVWQKQGSPLSTKVGGVWPLNSEVP